MLRRFARLFRRRGSRSSRDQSDGSSSSETGNATLARAIETREPELATVSSWTDQYLRQCVTQILLELPSAVTPEHPMQALEDLYTYVDRNEEDAYPSVVRALIEAMPHRNPLAGAVIALIIEVLPLPGTRQLRASGVLVTRVLSKPEQDTGTLVNASAVLANLASNFSGAQAELLCTDEMLSALTRLLQSSQDIVVLQTLLAIEMLALTRSNKVRIEKHAIPRVIYELEQRYSDSGVGDDVGRKGLTRRFLDSILRAQVGFCSAWVLDNVLPCPSRPVTVKSVREGSNVMLDTRDATKQLKLAPDGLEIRADVSSFESVKATCCANRGRCWYYEVTLLSGGIMQIGWATNQSEYQTEEGQGIGDDNHSFAIDGARQYIWHAQRPRHTDLKWKQGDIVGCFVNLIAGHAWWSVNGRRSEMIPLPARLMHDLYPAASLMIHQHVLFNFGDRPYKFKPEDEEVFDLNQFGELTEQQRHIIPRLVVLNELQQELNEDDLDEDNTCTICYIRPVEVEHKPCGHREFCLVCSLQCNDCPLCRTRIVRRKELASELASESQPAPKGCGSSS